MNWATCAINWTIPSLFWFSLSLSLNWSWFSRSVYVIAADETSIYRWPHWFQCNQSRAKLRNRLLWCDYQQRICATFFLNASNEKKKSLKQLKKNIDFYLNKNMNSFFSQDNYDSSRNNLYVISFDCATHFWTWDRTITATTTTNNVENFHVNRFQSFVLFCLLRLSKSIPTLIPFEAACSKRFCDYKTNGNSSIVTDAMPLYMIDSKIDAVLSDLNLFGTRKILFAALSHWLIFNIDNFCHTFCHTIEVHVCEQLFRLGWHSPKEKMIEKK